MSETINVQEAFDPELRQANRDMEAYLQARPAADSFGTTQEADGPHVHLNAEDYAKSKSDRLYDESLAEKSYENMSMSTLAKKLGQAELEKDSSTITSIEDVLADKMAAFADKVQEKSGKQSKEDKDAAADNIWNRVMRVKDQYKESVTTPDWYEARHSKATKSDETMAVDDPTIIELGETFAKGDAAAKERGAKLVTLEDQAVAKLAEAKAAYAAGDRAKADELMDEQAAILAQMQKLHLKEGGVIKPATKEVEPTEAQEAVVDEEAVQEDSKRGVRARLKAGWQKVTGGIYNNTVVRMQNRGERDASDPEAKTTRRNLLIGATALAATVIAGAAIYKGHDILADKLDHFHEALKQQHDLATRTKFIQQWRNRYPTADLNKQATEAWNNFFKNVKNS